MTFECPSPTGSASIGPLAEPVRVEKGLQRAAHEQRRELEPRRLLGGVDDRRHGAREPRWRWPRRAEPVPAPPGLQGVSRMPPDCPSSRCSSLLLAFPAAAPRRARQSMTFEAPRELLDPSTRDRALDEIHAFGVDRIRAARLLARLRARRRTRRRKPAFDADRPRRLPGRHVGPARRAVRRRRGARDRHPADADRAGAEVGDGDARRTTSTEPSPKEFQAVRRRPSARRYGDRVGHVVDLERAQPPALPHAAVRAREGEVAAHLPPALPRRRSAGCARAGNGSDTLLFGETAPRGTPRVVAPLAFLRGALCLNRSYHRRPAARSSRRAATPTTRTRRASARASARRTRTT